MVISETICAVATAPGRGGVGIVRVSGPLAKHISGQITQNNLFTRKATYCEFHGENHQILDQGIAIFFEGPHSFTGEDIVEFQGHGGPVVLDTIVERCLKLGARLARPGEFSERAFLNDKMDLTQAEAIADLINASSKQAATQALNSLRGAFAQEIEKLFNQLTQLRLYVESAIDFPEEEIDFLADGAVQNKLQALLGGTHNVLLQAKQGSIIRDGMKVVLAGQPNAGKSTLLNALAQKDIAIVTDVAGTTRDTLTEHIHIDGMPLHITDTAGLRDTDDHVEKIGIDRAWQAIDNADRILLLIDASEFQHANQQQQWAAFFDDKRYRSKLTLVLTKVDLTPIETLEPVNDIVTIPLSVPIGLGLQALKRHLLSTMGIENTLESNFSARRRHLDALKRCLTHLEQGKEQLEQASAGELLAEELRLAQDALGEITGKLSSDDLLGKIFSSFCIGK